MKARIRGVSRLMEEFDFYYGVSLTEMLLRHSDNLSAALQGLHMSAAHAQTAAAMTRDTISSLRNEQSFNMFWSKTVKLAASAGVGQPTLPRRRGTPARLDPGNQGTAYYPEDVLEHYRSIYYEAIDVLVTTLKDRFDQKDFVMYSQCEQVLLKAAKGEEAEKELENIIMFYGADFESLGPSLESSATHLELALAKPSLILQISSYLTL
jgi:hypothetical protein